MSETAPPGTIRRRAAHARGLQAEGQAAAFLERQGFEILDRRVRTKAGEIDLVARLGELLVFCEVKQRADLASAAFSLLPRQRRRIGRAAEIYLAAHPELSRLAVRFDAVLLAGDGRAEHLPGAFDMDG